MDQYSTCSHSIAGDSMYSGYSSASGYSMTSTNTVMSRPDTVPEQANLGLLAMAGQLPCEFIGYSHCDLTFGLDETQAWIDHIIVDHLRRKLPRKVICWFCDDYVYDAKRQKVDERTNFERRMWHIREHFVDGNGSVATIRPDHHLNEHLSKHKLISSDSYYTVCRTAEVRVPHGTIPRNTLPHELEQKEERKTYVYHNLQDEERRLRRQQKKKGDKVRSRQ